MRKYKKYLEKYINEFMDELDCRKFEKDPIMSLFIPHCNETEKDVVDGGAVYNNYGATSVSLANTVNSIMNINKFVFENKKYKLEQLNEIRKNNFENYEEIRKDLKEQNIRYGKDDEKKGLFGYDIELDELEKEILKDDKFYKLNNGGVTFSGGESILQVEKLEELLKKLKSKNINICVETALYVPEDLLDIALKYVDEFIVDVKILDSEQCKKVLNGDINLYYKNIEKLFKEKENIKITIPVTLEYTLNQKNKEKIIKLLDKYQPKEVELFKIHRLAEKNIKF